MQWTGSFTTALMTFRFLIPAIVAALGTAAMAATPPLATCNIVWDSPSRDSFDSMPLPGSRGAGANVWVQDGSLWIVVVTDTALHFIHLNPILD